MLVLRELRLGLGGLNGEAGNDASASGGQTSIIARPQGGKQIRVCRAERRRRSTDGA